MELSSGAFESGADIPARYTCDYYFRLYAVDEACELAPGMTRAQVLDRIHGHVLESTELLGRYRRQGA